MNLPIKNLVRSAGFTMIELLVVIAVIGVLAVAVLSSINPIEQINKGKDTRARSDAAQLINAVDRYFAVAEKYPWNTASYATALDDDTLPSAVFPDGTACDSTNGFCVLTGETNDTLWLDALSGTSEVKPSFITRIRSYNEEDALRVYKALGSNTTMFVCFRPSSNAFKDEAVRNCYLASQAEGEGENIPDGACPAADYTAASIYNEEDGEMICLPQLTTGTGN